MAMKISASAKRYMDERGIRDVTFKLMHYRPAGCCVGIVKEIEAHHQAPANACNFRYFHIDGYHLFISRAIKVLGPLELSLEGFWNMKRLALKGAGIPL